MYNKMDMIEVKPEILDYLWSRFLAYIGKVGEYYPKKYSMVSRNYGLCQQFESWLFSQGAIIQQRNKKRYIKFYTEEAATMFLLKWGI